MKLLKFELLKYIKNKFLLIILVLLFILSAILSAVSCYNGDINPKEYSKIHQITDKLSIEDAKEYIKEQKLYYQFYDEYYITANKNDIVKKFQDNYGEKWVHDSLLKLKDIDEKQLPLTLKVLDRLETEINSIESYPNLRQQFVKQSEQNKSISIFNNEKVIFKNQKILDAYKDVNPQMSLKLVPSLAFEQLISTSFPDFFCVVFIIYILGIFIYQERRRGFQEFTETMVNGGRKQYFIKFAAILIFTTICIVLEYLVCSLTISIVYGGLPIQATIQEIPLLTKSVINGNMIYLLVIFYIHKILSMIFIVVFLYVLAQFLRSYIILILVVVSLFAFSYLCYTQISPLDALSVFKYLNLYAILQSVDYLGNYICLTLFYTSIPFSIYQMFAITLFFMIIVLVLASGMKLNRFKVKKFHKKDRQLKPHSLFFYECKKVWIKDYGLLLFCIIICLQSIILANYKPNFTMDDIYYNNFVDSIGNQVNEVSEQRLVEMSRYYEQIGENTTNTQLVNYSFIEDLKRYPAFQEYSQNFMELKERGYGELLKENEYRLLFSDNIIHRFSYFFILLAILFIINRSFNREKEFAMDKMQLSCIKGGKYLWRVKIYSILTIIIPLNIFIYSTIIYRNHMLFPTVNYLSDINNLSLFNNYGCMMSIGLYLIFVFFVSQIIILSLVMTLSYFTMKNNRKYAVALEMILISFICFVLEKITGNTALNLLYFLQNVLFYPSFIILLTCLSCSIILSIYYWYQGGKLE